MFAKRLFVIAAAFAAALTSVTYCRAESHVVLCQSYGWEQNIDVFIKGDMNHDNLSCKVSNQEAQIVGSGLLADGDITVRTTILLDISKSMPSQVRENVMSLIDTFIQNTGKNEQYKIVVFGEQMTVLQDYTSDHDVLSEAMDHIAFTGQQSKIYDAIYNTIPKVQPIDGTPCYYRTIVITDGIDDTASGVTKEELYLKLQADTYPIDIVAVSKAEQAEPEKELSALTRMSSGRYVNLNPESDLPSLVSSLSADDVLWIRAIAPDLLLDGSTRQVNITDGVSSLQFDMKVPVYDIPVAETSAPEEEPSAETLIPTPAETLMPTPAETPTAIQAETPVTATPGIKRDMSGDYNIVIFISAGVCLIIVMAGIITVIIVRSRKMKRSKNIAPAGSNTSISQKTEILGGTSSDNSDKALCIRLRNISNPDQIWNLSLLNGIVIGRDTGCQVCIDDSSMSRQQCRLYLLNNAPMIENISQSNITQLNGELINNPQTIEEGDKIKCGRVILMVDSLDGSDSNSVGNLNKMTGFVNI